MFDEFLTKYGFKRSKTAHIEREQLSVSVRGGGTKMRIWSGQAEPSIGTWLEQVESSMRILLRQVE